jgi:FixJ family two-component response regulator
MVLTNGQTMSDQRIDDPIIYVVDDNPDVREGLKALLESVGLKSDTFESTAEFLKRRRRDQVSCLILDIRLPGLSGLDFQTELAEAQVDTPIIFITGYGDIPMTVKAMKAGAIEFLTKPFRDQDLLDAVNIGLGKDRERRENQAAVSALRARFDVLTARERTILTQVAAGRLNKQIASDMGITETTVKVHRSNAMRKIKASSLAELCRMVDKLKLPPESA